MGKYVMNTETKVGIALALLLQGHKLQDAALTTDEKRRVLTSLYNESSVHVVKNVKERVKRVRATELYNELSRRWG